MEGRATRVVDREPQESVPEVVADRQHPVQDAHARAATGSQQGGADGDGPLYPARPRLRGTAEEVTLSRVWF
jgi:hypothetical protein